MRYPSREREWRGSSHAGGLQEWARWGWYASRTYSAGMHDERQQVDAYRPHEATSEGCASWWRCGVLGGAPSTTQKRNRQRN
eukprot:scaffold125633_cov63-Phaeocystis_antarctica.AAC.6